MKKILLMILCGVLLSASVFAESAQSVKDKTRIYGRDSADSQNFEVISVIKTFIDSEPVYAVPVLMKTAVSIDSASITMDTAGLVGYQQIEDITKGGAGLHWIQPAKGVTSWSYLLGLQAGGAWTPVQLTNDGQILTDTNILLKDISGRSPVYKNQNFGFSSGNDIGNLIFGVDKNTNQWQVFYIDDKRLQTIDKNSDTIAALLNDTIILLLNNLADTLNLIYLANIAADSSSYIRAGISGNPDAITESVIEKINPITKEIITQYEYEYIYNGSGKLIGRILK